MYFDSIASLRAQAPVPLNTEFIVGGYNAPGDGGGGTFIWIPVPFGAVVDNGIILDAPSDPSGYFQRLISGPINVRWFGATGNGVTDDTLAVHVARDSAAFANNGTLYFPKGEYCGSFIFDFQHPTRNEINIKGDGHGSVLRPNDSRSNPVVILGFRYPGWRWAKISDLAIVGEFEGKHHIGVQFLNPSSPDYNTVAGRWVFERISITECVYGVFKPFSNIGNHFIDCTFSGNEVGVFAMGNEENVMHAGCDRYSGGHFDGHSVAGLLYQSNMPGTGQIIVDGTIFEQNRNNAWAVIIKLEGKARMTGCAICLRNVWFEKNGEDDIQTGGNLNLEGVRSVRIDDSDVSGRMHLVESSVNLYNCYLSSDKGGALSDHFIVDEKSSLVAYEHRYQSYPTNKVFVNSISYDGSQDIFGENWQPTSVWGPLRCVTTTRSSIVVSEQFGTSTEVFTYISSWGGSGNVYCYPDTMYVLGNGSGRLYMPEGGRIISNNVIGNIGPYSSPKYIVWSMHTYLHSLIPHGNHLDELFGEINSGGTVLGRVYFKYDQWACSYGMKLVDASGQLDMRLEFESAFAAEFSITDYQILAFDDLYSANSYVNSRAFAKFPSDK